MKCQENMLWSRKIMKMLMRLEKIVLTVQLWEIGVCLCICWSTIWTETVCPFPLGCNNWIILLKMYLLTYISRRKFKFYRKYFWAIKICSSVDFNVLRSTSNRNDALKSYYWSPLPRDQKSLNWLESRKSLPGAKYLKSRKKN